MKKILFSLMTIAVVALVGVAGTSAYFSDTETSTDNTFTAGAIDLHVAYDSTYNDGPSIQWTAKDLLVTDKFFNISDAKPGDYGHGVVDLTVSSNDSYLYGQIIPNWDDDSSSNEPEIATGDDPEDSVDLWDGELGANLEWTIWNDVNDDGVQDPGEDVIATGYAADLGHNPTGWIYLGTLNVGDTYHLAMDWNLPLSTGNEVQTDRYQADISFLAVQQRHMTAGNLPAPVPTP